MRLLICTQIVDRTHPVQGFFHRWLEEFATHFDAIQVICLFEGEHALPQNVSVYSLGKEKGSVSKIRYASRFGTYMRSLEGKYDAVYVHMNPEYVILGWPWWRKIPVGLWYNHTYGGAKLAVAASLVRYLFHTSPYAASTGRRKSIQMPVGIDTAVFTDPNVERIADSVYFQGRIAPAKRIHVLLEAFRLLKKDVPGATLDMVGPLDQEYVQRLRSEFEEVIGKGATFCGPKANTDTPALYGSHIVSVNLTAAGNFDKSALEPLSCGTPVVVSSPAFKGIVSEDCFFIENDAESLAATLKRILTLPAEERAAIAEQGRKIIEEQHSLRRLGVELARIYST